MRLDKMWAFLIRTSANLQFFAFLVCSHGTWHILGIGRMFPALLHQLHPPLSRSPPSEVRVAGLQRGLCAGGERGHRRAGGVHHAGGRRRLAPCPRIRRGVRGTSSEVGVGVG